MITIWSHIRPYTTEHESYAVFLNSSLWRIHVDIHNPEKFYWRSQIETKLRAFWWLHFHEYVFSKKMFLISLWFVAKGQSDSQHWFRYPFYQFQESLVISVYRLNNAERLRQCLEQIIYHFKPQSDTNFLESCLTAYCYPMFHIKGFEEACW